MPRVTISINAPNETVDGDLLTLDLSSDLTVKDLKAFIEAETSFQSQTQNLYLNGQPLVNDVQTLEQAGIKDGEMLAVLIRRSGSQGRPQASPAATTNRNPRGQSNRPDPEMVRLHILNNPAAQNDLRDKKPELLAVLHDSQAWRQAFENMQREEDQAERHRQQEIARLNEDPFNPENQARIEEMIRQERVIENLQHAYENNPEVFVRVHMLYINTEVNGHPVKAFVDSGAQATIMSPKCAEECGIMRLIDTRYSGIAKGVGTAKILGRVHHAEIKIGGAVMPCAFTVMEGKDVDLLFGLDMLKRYKAKIDLEKNALCFEGIEVPFLPENEIPKALEEAELNEPTVSGPNGTEIGARSGAVRPAGATASDGATVATGPPAVQPSSSGSAQAPANNFPPEAIEQLVNLGFTRQQAIQALEATGGNVEFAAGLLFNN